MNQHTRLANVKLTTLGNSTGITLSKEVLAKPRVGKGDTLWVSETPDGVVLTPYDPHFPKFMEAAEVAMRANRDALRALAK